MRHSTHPLPHPHNTDTLCSSTRDGVRGSNSSNENEIEINIDEKNDVSAVVNKRLKYTNKILCTFFLRNDKKNVNINYEHTEVGAEKCSGK